MCLLGTPPVAYTVWRMRYADARDAHGTGHEVISMRCGWRGPMPEAIERERVRDADLFIALGTSLQPYRVSGL